MDIFKRAILKIQQGGDLDTAINTFLMTYRYTPNKYIGHKSPSELMLGRKLRTTLDLIRPPNDPTPIVNEKQNAQFNKQYGAVQRTFQKDDLVFAKVFTKNDWKWVPGRIIERKGDVIYNVLLDTNNRLIRSHANQLLSRHSDSSIDDPSTSWNLNMLFDEFEMTGTHQNDDSCNNSIIDGAEIDESLLEEFRTPIAAQNNEESLHEDTPEPAQELNTRTRPLRDIRRPLRFQDYDMS